MFASRHLLFLIAISVAVHARAGDITFQRNSGPVSVIELYSSEGCSSCPPAEAWLSQWKDSPQLWQQVFPVAFHVDYWNGLGWPDRFARPGYTQRQQDYAAKLRQDSVYTPEFVVNGREWRGWFHGGTLPSPLATTGRLALTIGASNDAISADFLPTSATAGPAYTFHVCLLGVGIASDVERGENAGRHLRHDFVVLDFHSSALSAASDGHYRAGPISGDTGSDKPQAVVAWVSSPGTEVVQVVGGWLR